MLRGYQADICNQVRGAFACHRSVMVQMPTGTGKTLVLAAIVSGVLGEKGGGIALDKGRSVLIVAHRRELIEQIKVTILRMGIAADRVVVESIQSISRSIGEGICDLEPALVVVDEAHHALAKTYQLMWTRWPKAKFLGLTATPCRMNGEGFADLFDVLLESESVKRFVAEGWLSTYDYYSIKPDCEDQRLIDAIDKRGADGDYLVKELREKLDARPSILRLYETFRRFAADRKGIVYAIDILHAEHIADYYRAMGVQAVVVSSLTPKRLRDELILRFREGGAEGLQVLVSVDLFSEGFDCPDVEFIQLARPTLSLSKYLQMVGRGLRTCAGKVCCVILDNVGLYRAFGLPTAERNWQARFLGIPERKPMLDALSLSKTGLGILPPFLMEQSDSDVVKIVAHERLALTFAQAGESGFERVKRKDGVSWMDLINGISYDSCPLVVDFGGLELATDDELTFFPRIHSSWISRGRGIHRKVLETQVGCGISWQKLFIPLSQSNQGQVYQLKEVLDHGVRTYLDEQGRMYVQQDLDHPLLSVAEVGSVEAFIDRCKLVNWNWELLAQAMCNRKMKRSLLSPREWLLPEGAKHATEHGIMHVEYVNDGVQREYWIDTKTGYRHDVKPVLFERGFVELLREGDMVFVRNIRGLEGRPFHNWAIRADRNICTVNDQLYMKNDRLHCYDIKKRSDDFRMFVLEADFLAPHDDYKPSHLLVVNNSNRMPEIQRV